MGLDGVELMMDVEDHFGITIKSEELQHVRSVGDFVSLVHTRIVAADTLPYPLMSRFLELRALVRETTGNLELRIRPSERLESSLSAEERRRLWKRLPSCGVNPSSLLPPKPLRLALLFAMKSLLVAAVAYLAAVNRAFVPLALVVWAFVAVSLLLLAVNFRSIPPDGWTTFADVTWQMVSTVAATRNTHAKTPEAVLEELQPLVAKVLGVDESKVVPAARLVEDLGMD